MTNQIYPCLWFDGQAKAAAELYCSLFPNSHITSENPMVINWELDGNRMMGLNGGPHFQLNPSISLFVTCETNEEIDILWKALSEGGKIFMPLANYPWSEYYGWCGDKFGVTWQLFKGKLSEVNQKIVPSFLFANTQYGNAKAALDLYTALFSPSKIDGISYYEKNETQTESMVMHAQFVLNEKVFMAMDGAGDHNFLFNEAFSFVIPCGNQAEIDYFWENLTADGGEEGMCGWCKDKFGVSWQVIPAMLSELMAQPEKGEKVVQAFMQMKKFDIETLQNV